MDCCSMKSIVLGTFDQGHTCPENGERKKKLFFTGRSQSFQKMGAARLKRMRVERGREARDVRVDQPGLALNL